MTKIHLSYDEEDGDCETCGSHVTRIVKVEADGKTLELYNCDHMGDGNYDPFDPLDTTKKVLEFLGYEVTTEGVEP